ncbi:MAG: putative toxin-antitoxin system toxin component, PIN family [Desulfurivibrio sp.]
MKIVCDTNVLISGLLFGGNCRAIIGLVSEGRIDGFTTNALVTELEGVLLRPKFGLEANQVTAIVDLVRQTFMAVAPREAVTAVIDDPDDDAVLEAALAAGVDFVVSGDDHLLHLREFRGIRIVSPAELIEELR